MATKKKNTYSDKFITKKQREAIWKKYFALKLSLTKFFSKHNTATEREAKKMYLALEKWYKNISWKNLTGGKY